MGGASCLNCYRPVYAKGLCRNCYSKGLYRDRKPSSNSLYSLTYKESRYISRWIERKERMLARSAYETPNELSDG